MRVIGYVRVSTDRQAEEGVSLEAQAAKLRAYALSQDIELVDIIEDAGASAKTLDREGLKDALTRLKKKEADGLLILKLDRITRSVRDLNYLFEEYFSEKKGFELLSVQDSINTATAAGRLVTNVLMSVAQWEREAIGERTSAALRHKQSKGEYIGGGAPFGFKTKADGTLSPVKKEQHIVEEAQRLANSGLSLRAIAQQLDEQGHRSRTGRRFAPTQIKRMVA